MRQKSLSGSASAPMIATHQPGAQRGEVADNTKLPKLAAGVQEEVNWSFSDERSKKKEDFGYGVPRWSPYWTPKFYQPTLATPVSRGYGKFPESHVSQAHQLRENVENIREMKGWAKVDHTWELVGARPKWADDLKFIGITGDDPVRSKRAQVPLSEEKKRDYGYGVPLWSPYYYHRT